MQVMLTKEQRRDQLVHELTAVLFKLKCKDTERAIEAFGNFIDVTLLDEYGDEEDDKQ